MFINNFDPVAFQVFSLEVRWYSLAYIFGIIIGWLYCKKYLIKDKSILNIFDDLITYLIIGIILMINYARRVSLRGYIYDDKNNLIIDINATSRSLKNKILNRNKNKN